MYTPADFALIEKGLGLAKDKEKYLESFEIPLVPVSFAFISNKYEIALCAWKDKQIASYKQQLDSEHATMLKPTETDFKKKLADVQQKMETNRKRRREYD
jgi:hypothetical protein